MASLIEQPAHKADAPMSPHEQRIATAKAGMAAADSLWKGNAAVKAEATTGPNSHLSGVGVSTIKGIQPQANAKKADALDGLPHEVRRRAAGMAEGPANFLKLLHQRHAATKQAVEFTSADAAVVMDLPPDRAALAVKALEEKGFVRRSYSRLGNLIGYVPSTPA